jgi:hypothetical protein
MEEEYEKGGNNMIVSHSNRITLLENMNQWGSENITPGGNNPNHFKRKHYKN